MRLSFEGDQDTWEYTNGQGENVLRFGIGRLVSGRFPQRNRFGEQIGSIPGIEYDCMASAAWIDEQTLNMEVYVTDIYLGRLRTSFAFKTETHEMFPGEKGERRMLRIHFVNVGHGDCCLIEFLHTGRNYMIDINMTAGTKRGRDRDVPEGFSFSPSDVPELIATYKTGIEKAEKDVRLQDPLKHLIPRQNAIEYLRERKIESIFRFVSTHPHMDHLRGLADLMESVRIANFWILPNAFVPANYDVLSDSAKRDWNLYAAIRDCGQGQFGRMQIESPTEGTALPLLDEDGIRVLAPNDDLLRTAAAGGDENGISYVLLIQYGRCKILLGADALNSTWDYVAERHKDALRKVTVLKTSHHGLVSGCHAAALGLMSPRYAVITAGQKQYSKVSREYDTFCDVVFSTAWHGNVVFECDPNGHVKWETQYEHDVESDQSPSPDKQ